jgi:hypothetical protein
MSHTLQAAIRQYYLKTPCADAFLGGLMLVTESVLNLYELGLSNSASI